MVELSVEFVVGREHFPSWKLPTGCTNVRNLRAHLVSEMSQTEHIDKLTFHKEKGGRVLSDIAVLPQSPDKLFVDGPTVVVRDITVFLRRLLATAPLSAREGFSRTLKLGFTAPASARLSQIRTQRLGVHKITEEATTILNAEAATAVLQFWFEELTPDDWFRQSHFLDDRLRNDFSALHARASAGELAGWMARPDTCLALVVVLDQFSRHLYRGSPSAYACDGAARVAANTALARGDDRYIWPPGPRRAALYLPFMHSEDLGDKRRAVNLMRDGLVKEGSAVDAAIAERMAQTATLASSLGLGATTGTHLPKLISAQKVNAKQQEESKVNAKEKEDSKVNAKEKEDSKATPRAPTTKRTSSMTNEEPRPSTGGKSSANETSEANDEEPVVEDEQSATNKQLAISGASGVKGDLTSFGGGAARSNYSMQAALELPVLPRLHLNHEHAHRFRTMKLDAQTQQAYLRDRKDVSRVVRYQCLVCAMSHEFRLSKGAVGAEHQHL